PEGQPIGGLAGRCSRHRPPPSVKSDRVPDEGDPALFRARVIAATLLSATVVVATAGPAGANSAGDRRKQVKAQQSQVQIQLNLVIASNTRVEAEVTRLDHAVAAQQADLADARRAQSAADQRLAASVRHMADLGGREEQTKRLLAARAVD